MRRLIVVLCLVGLAVSASASTTTSSSTSTSTSTSSTSAPAFEGKYNVQPTPLDVPGLRVTGRTLGVAGWTPVHFCGQLTDGSTPAVDYLGPDVASYTLGGGAVAGDTVCDGLDSDTEATADLPLDTGVYTYMVKGMRCHVTSDPTADVVFTARSAAADLSPTVTCTVPGAGAIQDCYVNLDGPGPILNPRATIDVKVNIAEDLSAQDASCWWVIVPTS